LLNISVFMNTTLRILSFFLFSLVVLVPTARCDDLDDVLDYLVSARQAEQAKQNSETIEVQRASLALPTNNEPLFSAAVGYQVDPVKRSEEGGVIKLSTTYYSRASRATYEVTLVKAAPNSRDAAAFGLLKPLKYYRRLFQDASAQHVDYIRGYQTAFLDYRERRTSGSITPIGKTQFLVIRTSRPLLKDTLIDFASILPLSKIQP